MQEQILSYTVADDPAAAKRFDGAVRRHFWKHWLWFALYEVYRFALTAMFAVGLYCILSGGSMRMLPSLAGIAFAAVFGAVWSSVQAHREGEVAREADESEVWHCTISDEAWSFRAKDGTLSSHPWNTLQLLFRHDDGYLLQTKKSSILAYRKPLVDAGFDDLFLARLTHPADTA